MKPNMWFKYWPPWPITSETNQSEYCISDNSQSEGKNQLKIGQKIRQSMCVVNPEIVVILSLHCLTSLLILHHINCIKGLACLWCSDKNDEQQENWQHKYLIRISVKTQGVTLRWVKMSSHQALAETSKAFLGDYHGIFIKLFCRMEKFCPYLFPGSVVRRWISKI